MSAVEVVGVVAIGIGLVLAALSLRAAVAWLMWQAQWKFGNVRESRRYVRMGWQTGEPPEGAVILASNNAERTGLDFGWCVLQRVGDRLMNHGYSMPLQNLHAWLPIDHTKRADEGLDGQVQRAIDRMPAGWTLHIQIENGRTFVCVISPQGEDDVQDFGGDSSTLSKRVEIAVDHAVRLDGERPKDGDE